MFELHNRNMALEHCLQSGGTSSGVCVEWYPLGPVEKLVMIQDSQRPENTYVFADISQV